MTHKKKTQDHNINSHKINPLSLPTIQSKPQVLPNPSNEDSQCLVVSLPFPLISSLVLLFLHFSPLPSLFFSSSQGNLRRGFIDVIRRPPTRRCHTRHHQLAYPHNLSQLVLTSSSSSLISIILAIISNVKINKFNIKITCFLKDCILCRMGHLYK